MPLPEGYLPREGDVVLVPARVCYNVDPKDDVDEGEVQVFLRIDGDYQDRRIPLKNIVGIVALNLNPGDMVEIVGDETAGAGEVLAVHGDMVWLRYTRPNWEQTFRTCQVGSLVRVPKKPDPVVEEPAPPPPRPSRIDSDGVSHS